MSYLRRVSDKVRSARGRRSLDGAPERNSRSSPWEDQRWQFLTRFLFWGMYVAYFNLGDVAPRLWPSLWAVNLVAVLYPLLTLGYLAHAWSHIYSPVRWRDTRSDCADRW